MKKFLAFTSVMLMASFANAGAMISVGPAMDLGNGLSSYQVDIVGTEGDTITGIGAVNFDSVHQVWGGAAAGSPPPTGDTSPGSIGGVNVFFNQANIPFDSHFLFDRTDTNAVAAAPGSSIAETNNGSNPAGIDLIGPPGLTTFVQTAGMGSLSVNPASDGGGYGFLRQGGFDVLPLAQIVLPNSAQGNVTANVVVVGGSQFIPLSAMIGGGVDPMPGIVAGADLFFNGGLGLTLDALFTNDGDADLVIDGASLSGPDAGLFSFGALPAGPIAPGATAMIPVTLNGPIPAGTLPGTIALASLDVTSNAGPASVGLSAAIPEPSAIALAGLALIGLVGFVRRR